MEDQSRWSDIVHEHFKRKFKSDDAANPETTRKVWRHRVRMAIHSGHFFGELSFAEFCKAVELVKPNVATGRDNIPGTILQLLPEEVLVLVYNAVVERLAGRENSRQILGRVRRLFGTKKGHISCLDRWRLISLVPTLFKLYEVCM